MSKYVWSPTTSRWREVDWLAVDNQCFSSIMGIGVRQAGFDIAAKYEENIGFGKEQRGYGVAFVETNRHVFGDFPIEIGPADTWARSDRPWRGDLDLLFANPACSAFAQLSLVGSQSRANAGTSSPYLQGQRDAVALAARVRPRVFVMESVQGAYRRGLDVMRDHWRNLVNWSGAPYRLTHVLMNAHDVGSAQTRRRYFLVAHLDDFGVAPLTRSGRTLRDAIEDLADRPPGPGGSPDAHTECSGRRAVDAVVELAKRGRAAGLPMLPGEYSEKFAARLPAALLDDDAFKYTSTTAALANTQRKDHLPRVVEGQLRTVMSHHTAFTPRRMIPDQPSWAVTGGSEQFLHPWLDRKMTHRELGRIMGIPDDCVMEPTVRLHQSPWIGKAIPVESGQWIATSVRRSLEGDDGLTRGEEMRDGFGDLLIDAEKM